MTRMQTTLHGLARAGCAALALAAGAAHAQSDDLTIGIVNLQQVMEQAPQSRQVTQTLTQEFQPRSRELEQKRAELQEKQETYQRDAPVMGEQERAALEREIREGQRELQRLSETLQEDINIRRNEEVTALQQELAQQIQAYGREEGYDLILLDTIAIHVSEAADITAEVIEVIQAGGG